MLSILVHRRGWSNQLPQVQVFHFDTTQGPAIKPWPTWHFFFLGGCNLPPPKTHNRKKNKTPKALSKATTFLQDNRPPLLAADYYYSTIRRPFIRIRCIFFCAAPANQIIRPPARLLPWQQLKYRLSRRLKSCIPESRPSADTSFWFFQFFFFG